MKQTLITRFFNSILVLLGFSSAVSCEPGSGAVCMYGVPTMDFEVSGKVVDQDSAPIAGIKVCCSTFDEPGVATVFTAADGSFFISGTEMSPLLKFEDIDGPENGGEFAEKTEEIEVVRVKKGDGEWYLGKYEAKGVVIGLEKKQ